MKHCSLLTTFAFICFSAVADIQQEVFRKLSTVNTQWHKQPERNDLPKLDISNKHRYEDWITTHLELVETFLRQRNTSTLSNTQSANRSYLLQKLNGYWHERAFPVNDYLAYKTPVFIDRTGNHCAVGYLMQQSGAENLAQQINHEQPFALVVEIKTNGVKEWADQNGFSIEELAWIQPSYMPQTHFSEVGAGTNGPVSKLYPYDLTSRIIIAGSFDSIGNTPCQGIGYYHTNNNLTGCYGNGLAGEIKDLTVLYPPTMIVAAGSFDSVGVTYPLARYYQNNWAMEEIPGRQNATATTVSNNPWCLFEATIRHSSIPGKEELWRKNSNGQWSRQATFHGIVLNSHSSSYSLVNISQIWVGAFDSVTVHIDSVTDTTIYAHNVIFAQEYTNQWFGIEAEVSDTVFAAKTIGLAVYFAGRCNRTAPSPSNICLTRYLNGSLQTLITDNWFSSNTSTIYEIEPYEQNSILVAGDFEYIGNGVIEKNLLKYYPNTGNGESYGYFNDDVKSIAQVNQIWYLGGDFTKHGQQLKLAHLARIGLVSGMAEQNTISTIQIFPNPVVDYVQLYPADGSSVLQAEIFDITGRKVFEDNQSALYKNLNVQLLPSGIYTLRAVTTSCITQARMVK